MAVCSISGKATAAACLANGALTPHQQKLFLAYNYWLWGTAIGAVMPTSVTNFTEFAKCWQPLTDSQLAAFEILAVQDAITNASGSVPSVATSAAATTCIVPLSEPELDRIIGAIKCSLFQTLTAP